MRTLILGNGLIAGSLAKNLSGRGMDVTIVSRNIDDRIENVKYLQYELKDLVGDKDLFAAFDTVVHTMSSSSPASSMANVWQDAYDNILLNIKLFETLSSLQQKKLVFISSGGAVYGHPASGIADELNPTHPVSAYGIAKLSAEKYLQLFGYHQGLEYLILRPSNVYGLIEHIRKPQGVINHLLDSVLNGKVFKLWGSLDNHKDYLYVDDLAEAVRMVLQTPGKLSRDIYNISYGEVHSLGEIIAIVEKVTGKKILLEHMKEARFDVNNIGVDSSLFKKDFGWKPVTDIETGITRIYEKHLHRI